MASRRCRPLYAIQWMWPQVRQLGCCFAGRMHAQHIFMHGLHRMAISPSHHPQLRSAHRCASAGSHTLLFGCALWVFNCTGVPVALREVAPTGETHTGHSAFHLG